MCFITLDCGPETMVQPGEIHNSPKGVVAEKSGAKATALPTLRDEGKRPGKRASVWSAVALASLWPANLKAD